MPMPCPECDLLMDSNGQIAWCDSGHVWTLNPLKDVTFAPRDWQRAAKSMESARIEVTTRERAHEALNRATLLLARTGDYTGAISHIEEAIKEELAKAETRAVASLDVANAHHRKKMDEYTECQKERNALRSSLESIVKLMVSMQSLGYFTNDEWQSRLTTAQKALDGPFDNE